MTDHFHDNYMTMVDFLEKEFPTECKLADDEMEVSEGEGHPNHIDVAIGLLSDHKGALGDLLSAFELIIDGFPGGRHIQEEPTVEKAIAKARAIVSSSAPTEGVGAPEPMDKARALNELLGAVEELFDCMLSLEGVEDEPFLANAIENAQKALGSDYMPAFSRVCTTNSVGAPGPGEESDEDRGMTGATGPPGMIDSGMTGATGCTSYEPAPVEPEPVVRGPLGLITGTAAPTPKPTGPGLPEHEEVWSFRAECMRDVFCGWTESFNWRGNGIFMKRLEVEQDEQFPDVVGKITFRSLDGGKMLEGLKALAAEIRKYPDTHVLTETLKPSHHFNGSRDGPFKSVW